jgi:hypothetical protein
MPQLTRPAALALGVAAALLLSGCTGDTPVVLPSPQSTTAPVFASDEEALAAAEEAYGRYLAASASITKPNGEPIDSIAPFAHPDYLEELETGLQALRDQDRYIEGQVKITSAELQQLSDDFQNPVVLALYICLDVSRTRVVDEEGKDVTPERQEVVPLEVGFETEGREPQLVLTSSESWTGEDFCNQ